MNIQGMSERQPTTGCYDSKGVSLAFVRTAVERINGSVGVASDRVQS